MWRSRGRLPFAVDATCQLVEAGLAFEGGDEPRRRSEMELRLLYACVVLRSVNGIVEPGQKGAHAVSVESLAGGLGLPSWIVDLRHEASHKELPSLCTLRLAASFLLDYLAERYWRAQDDQLTFFLGAFRRLLGSYLDAVTSGEGDVSKCVQDIVSSVPPSAVCGALLPLLLRDSWGESAGRTEAFMLQSKPRASGNDQELQDESDGEMEELKRCWMPLLVTLHNNYRDFSAALASCIVECILHADVEQPAELTRRQNLLLLWLVHIIGPEWPQRAQVLPLDSLLLRCKTCTGPGAIVVSQALWCAIGVSSNEMLHASPAGSASETTAPPKLLSLEEMEQLIRGGPVWERCQSWVPCPIGTLPGMAGMPWG
jgi:hypothetical protein